jgi:hypothetical protein
MIDKERLHNHLNNGEREYIIAAAVYINDGNDYLFKPYNIDKGYVLSGWRHACIWETLKATTGKVQHEFGKMNVDWIDGFLTNKNRFLNRKESFDLVSKNEQLTKPLIGSELTSEDLW